MKFRIKFLIILNVLLLKNLNFAARLKQAELMSKTDFGNKITSFNRQLTSNKTRPLEVQKKLNSLITKDYSFWGRIYFTSNHGSRNRYVYQPKIYALELKIGKGTDYVLNWKSKRYIILKLYHYILLS